ARLADNGLVEIQARASDANFDPSGWKFEWQSDQATPWQAATLERGASIQPVAIAGSPWGGLQLRAYWRVAASARPVGLRAIVSDRAGNSATYQTRIEAGTTAGGPFLTPPTVGSAPATGPTIPSQTAPALSNMPGPQTNNSANGWTSASVGSTQ